MSLQVPATSPLSSLPVLSRSQAQMLVFSGFPDEQGWLEEALTQSEVCGSAADVRALRELGPLAWGAPLGNADHESERVARATGVFVEGEGDERCVTGVALAHARCWAYWMPCEDGELLTLEFQEPSSYGFGVGKDRLGQEQLKAMCLRQLKPQAQSILENVADPETAVRLSVIFTGNWDDTTEFVRKSLEQHALKVWHEVTLPGAQADQLQAA